MKGLIEKRDGVRLSGGDPHGRARQVRGEKKFLRTFQTEDRIHAERLAAAAKANVDGGTFVEWAESTHVAA
jgi:hypothetical protein